MDMRNTCNISVGKPKERNNLGDLGMDGRTILKPILKK
jgi:hypothetical protein